MSLKRCKPTRKVMEAINNKTILRMPKPTSKLIKIKQRVNKQITISQYNKTKLRRWLKSQKVSKVKIKSKIIKEHNNNRKINRKVSKTPFRGLTVKHLWRSLDQNNMNTPLNHHRMSLKIIVALLLRITQCSLLVQLTHVSCSQLRLQCSYYLNCYIKELFKTMSNTK